MRTACLCLLALLAFGLLGPAAQQAVAQPAGLNPNRDCFTVRSCRYTSGGYYRGCVSSYSCRVCSFVRTSCRMDAGKQVCQALRCTWG
jgi:hypothetical protein